jgi:hypothetical protein
VFVDEFISEDDLKMFDGWLRYQAVNKELLAKDELATWQAMFEDARQRSVANPQVGLMKLPPVPGEFKYAVAVREGADLWLVLWVRRSRNGNVYVLKPSADKDWNPHTSYHRDGSFHHKSWDRKVLPPQKRQPLTGPFKGCEPLMQYAGHFPKTVGAVCDPTAFTGVVEVSSGILGPRDGSIAVDLVEPSEKPSDSGAKIVSQTVFREAAPNVVITILGQSRLPA